MDLNKIDPDEPIYWQKVQYAREAFRCQPWYIKCPIAFVVGALIAVLLVAAFSPDRASAAPPPQQVVQVQPQQRTCDDIENPCASWDQMEYWHTHGGTHGFKHLADKFKVGIDFIHKVNNAWRDRLQKMGGVEGLPASYQIDSDCLPGNWWCSNGSSLDCAGGGYSVVVWACEAGWTYEDAQQLHMDMDETDAIIFGCGLTVLAGIKGGSPVLFSAGLGCGFAFLFGEQKRLS